jgi:ABC-type uncharacterized transport system substrate-binding protein
MRVRFTLFFAACIGFSVSSVVFGEVIKKIVYLDPVAGRGKSNEARFVSLLQSRKACRGVAFYYVPVALGKVADDIIENVGDSPDTLVIAASGYLTSAVLRLLPSVKVVFQTHSDPQQHKFVSNLNASASNATGISYYVDADLKRVELLRDLVPNASVLAVVADSDYMGRLAQKKFVLEAHRLFGFKVKLLVTNEFSDFERYVATERIDAIYVPYSLPSYLGGAQISALAAEKGIPSMFDRRRFLSSGATFAYESVNADGLPVLASAAGLICAGVPPDAIPVERSRVAKFGINLKEARRLRLDIPVALVRLADEVVQ